MLYKVLYNLTYKVTYMKRVNFRISETTYEQLKQLAEQRGESMNAAVQYAVQNAVQGAVQEKAPEQASEDGVWRDLFLKEHEKLLELTDKVADSLHASQTLQAMDKPALESAEAKEERLSRWERLKRAWRG